MTADAPSLEQQLTEIVRGHAPLMHVLTTVRSLDLPDWRIFSGAVYQAVWNIKTGRPVDYGVKDYDLGYFDPDTSWDAEDAVIKRAASAFEAPFSDMVEVRNQARVHLWFKDRFGGHEDYTALTCTDDAPARFVAPCFAVGVRLEADDSLSLIAPFGLEDVFSLTVRPNPTRPRAGGWDKIIANARGRWPELTVVDQV